MLALARKVNESIVINDDVEVNDFGKSRGPVKIASKAAKISPVYRKEL